MIIGCVGGVTKDVGVTRRDLRGVRRLIRRLANESPLTFICEHLDTPRKNKNPFNTAVEEPESSADELGGRASLAERLQKRSEQSMLEEPLLTAITSGLTTLEGEDNEDEVASTPRKRQLEVQFSRNCSDFNDAGTLVERMSEFWKGLGDDPTEEEDTKRAHMFFDQYSDECSFQWLLDQIENLLIEVADSLTIAQTLYPSFVAVIRERCEALQSYLRLGEAFAVKFGSRTERLSSLLFTGMMSHKDEAVLEYQAWARPLSMLTQDLAASIALMRFVLTETQPGGNVISSERAVLCFRHNTAISCVDFLIHCGYQCRGFSGPEKHHYLLFSFRFYFEFY